MYTMFQKMPPRRDHPQRLSADRCPDVAVVYRCGHYARQGAFVAPSTLSLKSPGDVCTVPQHMHAVAQNVHCCHHVTPPPLAAAHLVLATEQRVQGTIVSATTSCVRSTDGMGHLPGVTGGADRRGQVLVHRHSPEPPRKTPAQPDAWGRRRVPQVWVPSPITVQEHGVALWECFLDA